MNLTLDINEALAVYRTLGGILNWVLLGLCAPTVACIAWQSTGRKPMTPKADRFLMWSVTAALGAGVLLVCYLHLAIYHSVPLKLPAEFAPMINRWISAMAKASPGGLAPYDLASPPRFFMPPWLENEKFLFWFFCYALMASLAYAKATTKSLRLLLQGLLAVQVLILTLATKVLTDPLPNFFSEVNQWFLPLSPMERLKVFMQLYPRMVFFYNAHYMWIHPPLLFISYAALTIFFAACVSMLLTGDREAELLGYTYASPGYIALTMGMLLGFPWALQAWGPNWWWDPKIASSIMMWVVFSTYLHARLYLSRRGMWSFVGWLGILCFAAMVFTICASYIFPGEHTVH